MPAATQFAFDDAGTFDQNLARYAARLIQIDPNLGPPLSEALTRLAAGEQDRGALLNALVVVLNAPPTPPATNTGGAQSSAQAPHAPPPLPAASSPPVRWFLQNIEIEGFRGINNEGTPLALKFKSDCVNSISAPNGVGKSSIYDALSFALTGGIPKLDRLLQSERPQDYYLNRFHPGGSGTIKLTLLPDNGGQAIQITVRRSASGVRTVTGPAGVNANALLSELNREFVLLDGDTFRSFIDDKALDRGRAFSGLLGMSRYSLLRQQLQGLANTKAFNSHFDVTGHAARKASAERNRQAAALAIATDYQNLVKEPLQPTLTSDEAQARCHAALHAIPVLTTTCASHLFMQVDVEACIAAVKVAEGGPKRERLAEIIREQEKWTKANRALPAEADLPLLATLVKAREENLRATSGALMHELYQISERVMTGETWPSPSLCPTCERDDGTSVLERVRARLGQYDAVELSTSAVAAEWTRSAWGELLDLEALTLLTGETPRMRQLAKAGEVGSLSLVEAEELAVKVKSMRERAAKHIEALSRERSQLEQELPPSLVAVTTAIETARRLQTNWRALTAAAAELKAETDRATQVTRIKSFLDNASLVFATAESAMAASRLMSVQPVAQDLFSNIMFSPVVPALQKPPGSEELGIKLAEFWSLRDLSAQALLSESFRNGFAVSVYLAAASLYGGTPRFVILDDVTSSFDAGHQHHLIEVIRTRFARPLKPSGPQVILLSHDTLLEKLFNKNSSTTEWSHQRLEGTARTAVLPQSGAVNKVRDTTIDLLNVGRVDDAAPRIRQYLEYILHDVIDRCRIPVPLDLAFGDDKRTPGEYLKAIQDAVDLHDRAGDLVLDVGQVQALAMHSTTIVANYLSHWSTGQTQAFSAPALLGVMRAIDAFPDCFKYELTPGARVFYRSLNRR
jgi:AAA domain